MTWRLGIDVGGTFTDLVLFDSGGRRFRVAKELTTPDIADGIIVGVESVCGQAGITLADVRSIVHATTVAANTVIQATGARVGLVTTRGFRDVIFMGRQVRHSTYDIIDLRRHVPLVAREHVYEIDERMASDGTPMHAPDDSQVREVLDRLRADEIESLAVGLLNSYRNPVHEEHVAARLAAVAPDLPLSVSSQTSREIGEYERLSTCVANAYLRPAFTRYVGELQRRLAERGFTGALHMMQSNGGLSTIEQLEATPVAAIEAGPAAGVVAARSFARLAGTQDLFTLDMGGTTAKACLVSAGAIPVRTEIEVDTHEMRPGTGIPLRTASVDVLEIGAGGGSIATVEFGIVRTGPQSAGAEPGPACYGLGGDRPTVTDANLVLGYLDEDWFASGSLRLDRDAAVEAIRREVAASLSLPVEEAAWAIHEAVTLDMEHALRAVSIERGRDPRRYALVALGGAAPTHAGRLARRLGIDTLVVPPSAGVASACGLLESDVRFDVVRSVAIPASGDGWTRLTALLTELEAECRALLGQVGEADPAGATFRATAEMSYAGQGHMIEVALDGVADLPSLRAAFVERYTELYGFAGEGAELRIAGLRGSLTAATEVRLTDVITSVQGDTGRPVDPHHKRRAYFPELGGYVESTVLVRDELAVGSEISGPAVIQDPECTVLVLPDDRCRVDEHHNLVVTVGAAGSVTGRRD